MPFMDWVNKPIYSSFTLLVFISDDKTFQHIRPKRSSFYGDQVFLHVTLLCSHKHMGTPVASECPNSMQFYCLQLFNFDKVS